MSKATVSASTSVTPKGVYDDVDHSEAPGHGNSPAAWTCVIVMLVGLIIGFVMRKAGYGVGGSKLKNSGH